MSDSSQKPLLTGRVRLRHQGGSFFTRALLFPDRLELVEWSLTGRRQRQLPLRDVERVEWWSMRDDVNLALFLRNGEEVLMNVAGAGTWKFTIDSLLSAGETQAKPRAGLRARSRSEAA